MTPKSILLSSDKFSDAFHWLFQLRKRQNPKLSIAYMCRRCELKSRGVVCEAMAGNRRLSAHAFEKISAFLALEETELACFRALWSVTFAKTEADKHAAAAAVDKAKLKLRIAYRDLPLGMATEVAEEGVHAETAVSSAATTFFMFKVVAAFGLFGNQASVTQLKTVLGGHQGTDIQVAINSLLDIGVIKVDVDASESASEKTYTVDDSVVMFHSSSGISLQDYVKASAQQVATDVDQWFEQRDMSCFYSLMVSTKKADYQAYLAGLKRQLQIDLTKLERPDGDMVLQCGVQLYPLLTVAATAH